MINLVTLGLRQSLCLREKENASSLHHGSTTMAYSLSTRNGRPFQRPKHQESRISLFSVFCTVCALWSFATSTVPHFFNGEHPLFVARVSGDYQSLNDLFNNTFNDMFYHEKSLTASNEAFLYKQMLKEDDFEELFQAMLDEIEVREKRNYWTLVERKNLAVGLKTIIAI